MFRIVALMGIVCCSLANAAGPTEPELRKELLTRFEKDQKTRKTFMEFMSRHGGKDGTVNPFSLPKEEGAKLMLVMKDFMAIDAENTDWMKKVIDKHGWPSKEMVGDDGARAAWALVQHADKDRKFQERCLKLMLALPKESVPRQNVAALTDRLLVAKGEPQEYGTQAVMEDGDFVPNQIRDEANVDKRRAELGLPPLADYMEAMRKSLAGKPTDGE